MAANFACDSRELQELVLATVGGASSRADDQAAAWTHFVKNLPYRREPVEILRNPLETAKYGGDCDDLVVLLLAGWLALSLECHAEIIADADGNGFHIRALCGFPVLKPELWVAVDPVSQSEAAWATAIPQDLPLDVAQRVSDVATRPPIMPVEAGTGLEPTTPETQNQRLLRYSLYALVLYGGVALIRRITQDED